MDKNISYEGSCSCGVVKYFINDYPLFTHACHCRDCKKSTGWAFVIHTIILENSFFIIKGDMRAATLPTSSGAGFKLYFCINCGTYIYCKYDMAPERIIIRTSTLNDSDIFPPQAHIFTKNKATWINLDDKIPFFERMCNKNKIWPKTILDKLNTVL